MACSEQCSMCIMSLQVQMQVHFQVQVQCVVYTVQCVGPTHCTVYTVGCSVLPAKDEDLAVETGGVKFRFYLSELLLKTNNPNVFFRTGSDYWFLKALNEKPNFDLTSECRMSAKSELLVIDIISMYMHAPKIWDKH